MKMNVDSAKNLIYIRDAGLTLYLHGWRHIMEFLLWQAIVILWWDDEDDDDDVGNKFEVFHVKFFECWIIKKNARREEKLRFFQI